MNDPAARTTTSPIPHRKPKRRLASRDPWCEHFQPEPVVALADLDSHTLVARDRLQQAGGVGGAAGDRAAGAERIERGTTVMSMETFLVIVFLGGSLWAWAKWEREKQEGRRRRDEEDRIIAEHQRGLTNEEIAKMLGVGTERVRELVDYNDVRVRELVDYWRFANDEPLLKHEREP
jgi:hypothetical protein